MVNRLKMFNGMSGMQKAFSLEEAKAKSETLPEKKSEWTVAQLEKAGISVGEWTLDQINQKLADLTTKQSKLKKGGGAYLDLQAQIDAVKKRQSVKTIENAEDKSKTPTKIKGGQSGYTALNIGDAAGETLAFTKKEGYRRIAKIQDQIVELNTELGNKDLSYAVKAIREKFIEEREIENAEDPGGSEDVSWSREKYEIDEAIKDKSKGTKELKDQQDFLEKKISNLKSKIASLSKVKGTKVLPKLGIQDLGKKTRFDLDAFDATFAEREAERAAIQAELPEIQTKKAEAVKSLAEFRLDLEDYEEELTIVTTLQRALAGKKANEEAALISNEADLKKAEARKRRAENKVKGLTGGQRSISTDGLNQLESLIYKEQPKTAEAEEYAKTFNGMIQTARSKAATSGPIARFQSAVVNLNGIMRKLAIVILSNNPGIQKHSSAKNTLAKLKDTEIEKNSDLVKLCWLYLGGEETFKAAKNSPEFIKALKVLESRNINAVVADIDRIHSVDDIVNNPKTVKVVGQLFSGIKADLEENKPARLAEIASDALAIAKACSSLVVTPAKAKEYNIADTLRVGLINIAGGDMRMLAKSPGDTSTHLTQDALKLIAAKEKEGEKSVQGRYVQGSRGHKSEPTRYKLLGLEQSKGDVRSRAITITPEDINKISDEEVASALQLSGIAYKTIEDEEGSKTVYIPNLKDSPDASLRELFLSGKAKKEAIATLLKAHFEDFLSRPEGLRSKKAALEAALTASTQNNVKASDTSRQKQKEVLSTQLNSITKVLDIVTAKFDKLIKDVKKLKPDDIAALADVFKAAVTPEDAGTAKVKNSIVSTDSEEGQAAFTYITSVLEAINEATVIEPTDPNNNASAVAVKAIEEEIAEQEETLEAIRKVVKNIDAKTDADDEAEADKKLSEKARNTLFKKRHNLTTKEAKLLIQIRETQSKLEIAQHQHRYKVKDWNEAWSVEERDRLIGKNNVIKERFEVLLKDAKSSNTIDLAKLKTFYDTIVPKELNKLINIKVLANIISAFKTLKASDPDVEAQKTDWQKKLRIALRDLGLHLSSPELLNKDSDSRSSAINALITPFRDSLKETSEFSRFVEEGEGLTAKQRKSKGEKAVKGSIAAEEDILQADLDAIPFNKAFDSAVTVLEKGLLFIRTIDNQPIGILGVSPESEAGKKLVKMLTGRGYTEFPVPKEGEERDIQISDIEFAQSSKNIPALVQAALETQSLMPGSALKGTPELVRKDVLERDLYLNNLYSPDGGITQPYALHAKAWFSKILTAVRNLNLANRENEDFENDSEFIATMIKLLGDFKETLSLSPNAADFENNVFLQKLLTGEFDDTGGPLSLQSTGQFSNKKSYLPSKTVMNAVRNSPQMREFLDYVSFQRSSKKIGWPVRVLQAPVIAMGNNTLGLKSATLLNIMSCIRSFNSPDAFDLSLNKKDEDVLSNLLNINNYPSKFGGNYATAALMMKLYFLITLKNATDKVDIVKQFSDNFINVTISDEDAKKDEALKRMQAQLANLNKTIEDTILSEFTKDFSADGTLDQAIKQGLERLKFMADSVDGSIDVWKQGSELGTIALPEDPAALREFVATLGKSVSSDISEGMRNEWRGCQTLSPAAAQMTTLLLNRDDEKLIAALHNAITIVKNGLSYSCALKVKEVMAKADAYDPITKQFNQNLYELAVADFKAAPEVIAFTNKFGTQKTNAGDVTIADEDGFENLDNNFLGSFIAHFTYDALLSSLTNLDLDEFVDAHNKSFDTSTDLAELEQHKVAITGIYQKGAGQQEESVDELTQRLDNAKKSLETKQKELNAAKDSDTTELQAEVSNINKTVQELSKELNLRVVGINTPAGKDLLKKLRSNATAKTKSLAEFGTVPQDEVLTVKKDANGNAGCELKRGTPMGFKDVTKESKRGFSEGIKGGETSKGRRGRHEIKSVNAVIQQFETGIKAILPILVGAYSADEKKINGFTSSERIEQYRKGIVNSTEAIKQAVDAVAANPYGAGVQEVAIEGLKAISAVPPPAEVEILVNPALAFSHANKSFEKVTGEFHKLGKFAEQMAIGIINTSGAVTTQKVIDALNQAMSNTKLMEEFKSGKRGVEKLAWNIENTTTASTVTVPKIQEILPSAYKLFKAGMTKGATLERLEATKGKGVAFPNEAKIKADLETTIKPLQDKINTATKEKEALTAQINAAVKGRKAEGPATDIAALQRQLIAKTTTIATNTASIAAAKKETDALLAKKEAEIPMMAFLNRVYVEAENMYNNYIKTLPETEDKNKPTKYFAEIKPLIVQIPAIEEFMAKELEASGKSYKPAKALLEKFRLLFGDTKFVKSYNESVTLNAVVHFMSLLETANDIKAAPVEKEYKSFTDVAELGKHIKSLEDKRSALLQPVQVLDADGNEVKESDAKRTARIKKRNAIDAELEIYRKDKRKLEDTFKFEGNPYILSMAYTIWSTQRGIDDAKDYTVMQAQPGKIISVAVPAISKAIQAAVIVLLKKDNNFINLLAGFNSSLHLGFSVDPTEDAVVNKTVKRKMVYAQISDFNAIKKIAQHDMKVIDKLYEKQMG